MASVLNVVSKVNGALLPMTGGLHSCSSVVDW